MELATLLKAEKRLVYNDWVLPLPLKMSYDANLVVVDHGRTCVTSSDYFVAWHEHDYECGVSFLTRMGCSALP